MKHRDAPVFLAAFFAILLGVGFLPWPAQLAVVWTVLPALWVWAIVDAARAPDQLWSAARRSKTIAIVVLVLLGPAMALTYVISIRPDLRRRFQGA